ncbi:MAG TPA: ATP-grasp domain-containing protein [Pirellulaceae bacterium]|nr:ATP-grasp domain-containing protein [Pirellulaceae bacterium]
MAIRIWEYTVGGGRFAEATDEAFPIALRREGRAMIGALVRSCSPELRRRLRIAWDPQAGTPPDDVAIDRIDSVAALERWFDGAADEPSERSPVKRERGGLLIIAPETDGRLARWTERAEKSGARLLSPCAEFVRLASDKTATTRRLAEAGVPVPREIRGEQSAESLASETRSDLARPLRCVIKDRFGCGGVDMVRWRSGDWGSTGGIDGVPHPLVWPRERWHVEQEHEGTSVGIFVLVGPGGYRILPPIAQRQGEGGSYLGGSYPLAAAPAQRAMRLARRVVTAMPKSGASFGIDLILGNEEQEDVVLEVNPRLVSSWIGLSQRIGPYLGDALLAGDSYDVEPQPIDRRRRELIVDPTPLMFDVSHDGPSATTNGRSTEEAT